MRHTKALAAAISLALCLPSVSQGALMSYTDLWDVSQGAAIGPTSGALYYSSSYHSDIRNMFGANHNTGWGAHQTVFKDYNSPYYSGGPVAEPYTHWVEWHTPAPITLRAFNLVAMHDGHTEPWYRDIRYRGFTTFNLYSGDGSGNWDLLYTYDTDSDGDLLYGGGVNYTPANYLELEVNITPVVAQYFKAEFVQTDYVLTNAAGSRVCELDGYDTPFGVGAVPEPASLIVWSLLAVFAVVVGWRWRKRAA